MKIALSGKMFSGKTAIAEYLRAQHGFVEIAFADKLKDIAEDLFGMSAKRKDRELLQVLGMKMREIDSQIWIRYVVRLIPCLIQQRYSVVVSDVRFMNEFDSLRKTGFIMIRCDVNPETQEWRIREKRPDMPRILRLHVSEVQLDNIWKYGRAWDYMVTNEGTPKELLEKVDVILEMEANKERRAKR